MFPSLLQSTAQVSRRHIDRMGVNNYEWSSFASVAPRATMASDPPSGLGRSQDTLLSKPASQSPTISTSMVTLPMTNTSVTSPSNFISSLPVGVSSYTQPEMQTMSHKNSSITATALDESTSPLHKNLAVETTSSNSSSVITIAILSCVCALIIMSMIVVVMVMKYSKFRRNRVQEEIETHFGCYPLPKDSSRGSEYDLRSPSLEDPLNYFSEIPSRRFMKTQSKGSSIYNQPLASFDIRRGSSRSMVFNLYRAGPTGPPTKIDSEIDSSLRLSSDTFMVVDPLMMPTVPTKCLETPPDRISRVASTSLSPSTSQTQSDLHSWSSPSFSTPGSPLDLPNSSTNFLRKREKLPPLDKTWTNKLSFVRESSIPPSPLSLYGSDRDSSIRSLSINQSNSSVGMRDSYFEPHFISQRFSNTGTIRTIKPPTLDDLIHGEYKFWSTCYHPTYRLPYFSSQRVSLFQFCFLCIFHISMCLLTPFLDFLSQINTRKRSNSWES